MEYHHGMIGVNSTGVGVGNGSTFFIEIPATLRTSTTENKVVNELQHTHLTENQCSNEENTVSKFEEIPDQVDSVVPTSAPSTKLSSSEKLFLPNPKTIKEIKENKTKLYQRGLVVDDSKLNRKMLIAALSKYFDTIDQVRSCCVT